MLLTASASAASAGPPGVTPNHVELTMHPGDSKVITKTVVTPEILPKPDIYFLADTTGSMEPALANVQANATDILNQVDAVANSPQFGAGQYKDFPASFGYKNDASITATKAAVTAAIGTWVASDGSDTPEANLFALHNMVGAAGFRADSNRIVVWFGDAPGHDPVCSAISGEAADVTEASVTAELVAAGVQVIAVSVTTGPVNGLNADPGASAGDYTGACGATGSGSAGQADRIAAATGGTAFSDVPPSEVANKIIEGLTALPVTIKPVATCTAGLSASFNPTEKTVTSGSSATFTETLMVAPSAVAGVGTCTVEFLLNGLPAGAAFTEKNTITVNRPPDCTKASVTPKSLWPPNHKFQTVTASVPDADGDTVTTTVTAVTQDEALNGGGDGDTSPDAAWVAGHANQVQVRAERSGLGDGRVYRISVTATDGKETCSGGLAYVSVPHDQSGPPAVNTVAVVVNSFGP
jgi:hypothetical protein